MLTPGCALLPPELRLSAQWGGLRRSSPGNQPSAPPALGRDCIAPCQLQLSETQAAAASRSQRQQHPPPFSRQTRSHTIPHPAPACRTSALQALTPHSPSEHWGTHSVHCFHGMKIHQARPPLYPLRSLSTNSGVRGALKPGPLSWRLLIPLATSRPTHSTPTPQF